MRPSRTESTTWTVLLLLAVALPLGAQQRNATAGIPSHVRGQLWPERPLSPDEQALKDHVIVLRDTLAVLDGSAALLQRQQRGNAGPGVLRSSGRRIAGQCAAGTRAAGVMERYAKDLTTDDAKWGQPAVRSFRASITRLVRGMAACEERVAALVAAEGGPDGEALARASVAAQAAIADYTTEANRLINTLEIRIDPRGSQRPGG